MLPQTYELPGAILLILGGAVACVAGYRLFKTVLGVYGFIFGALIASSVMGVTNTARHGDGRPRGRAGWRGGDERWRGSSASRSSAPGSARWRHISSGARSGPSDPPAVAVIVASVVGAIVAMVLQRYVIVIGTAFGGAWTIIVGVLNAMAAQCRHASPPAPTVVWILYPLTPSADAPWVPMAWIVLGLFGTLVQLGLTSKRK